MSPYASQLLMEKIVPSLRRSIPHVKRVGSEDIEELVQDATLMAARMLTRNEANGKPMFPSTIAQFTLGHIKEGRRSYGSGRRDAMAPTTQLDSHSQLIPLDEPISHDPTTGENLCLAEMLACPKDDPSQSGARNLDWNAFMACQIPKTRKLVSLMTQGLNQTMIAKQLKLSGAMLTKKRKPWPTP